MDPVTKYPGPEFQKTLLNKFYGYNLTLAHRFAKGVLTYTSDDFLQVGRMALLGSFLEKPEEKDKYYKQVIRFAMAKFKRDNITKVAKNEQAYKEILSCEGSNELRSDGPL